MHSDQKYINGLAENNSYIIEEIYRKFVPKIKNYILQNSGNIDDAQDVIQDVLLTIYHQAKQNNLALTCPFDAYFFLLCKRKWLNELNKSRNKEVTISETTVSIDDSTRESIFSTELFGEKQALFEQMFEKLGEKCKEVIQLSFSIKSMEEVAEKLNVTYAYVRKKKSICISQLTEMIQQSTLYQQLKS